jgi:hypothetical protein
MPGLVPGIYAAKLLRVTFVVCPGICPRYTIASDFVIKCASEPLFHA